MKGSVIILNVILQGGKNFFKNQSPARLITLGFAFVILAGTILLKLPVSVRDGAGVSWIDALFTSTSAVCVTGLIAIDTAEHFTVFGRTVVAVLIQIGGLGVTSVGVGIILAAGKRIGFKERLLVKEALNVNGFKGMVVLVKYVLIMTLCFETAGTILSYLVFVQKYSPLDALGISMFHSVAAFNNSGFDILGGLKNLIPYQDNVLLNLTTCGLIIFGGLGFLVILDIIRNRCFKKLCLHSKAVIVTSIALIVTGTVLLKCTENITWLGAFFQSVSARTAGFSTYPIGNFTSAGLFILTILMFIGASPGSTGGGIKTSTLFVLLNSVKSTATNQHCTAFRRKIPDKVVFKAFMITFLSLMVVSISTLVMCVLEPEYSFLQLLFECTSAFGTVGLSTGITPDLGTAGKLVIILTMFIGRLGTLTIITMWSFKQPANAVYTEENITIG
ncbi:H(+)-transporting ATPase [Clostridium sp. AF19-22AC]|nr:H(+)-transporting ATPase [Clostridium sp. AF19-22AC]